MTLVFFFSIVRLNLILLKEVLLSISQYKDE